MFLKEVLCTFVVTKRNHEQWRCFRVMMWRLCVSDMFMPLFADKVYIR